MLGGLGWPMAQQNPGARVTGVTVTGGGRGPAGTVGRGVGGGLGPRVRGCGAGRGWGCPGLVQRPEGKEKLAGGRRQLLGVSRVRL